jgi:glycogen debranching enzyme
MRISQSLIVLSLGLLLLGCSQDDTPYKIQKDKVIEGKFMARSPNARTLLSSYPMRQTSKIDQPILLKLSINGRDNEGGYGEDHFLVVPDGVTEFFAPTLQFGKRLPPPPANAGSITQSVNVHFRVNFAAVLRSFDERGFYVTPTADTIKTADFKGLYLAGNQAPLAWIWDDPAPSESLKFEDSDQDSIFELTIRFQPESIQDETRRWELSENLSGLPRFSSPQAPLLEALTNLALEEAQLNIREDGAFSAGKEWRGIWTRDVSYAGQLSLAYYFPDQVKTSLRAKLNPEGRIIQDTGTGGAWPISSDRFVWILAAWEVYLATGDEAWLEEIKGPALSSLKEDILWNRDPVSGMLLGETSFEDWREQTYPPWMSPADIHASQALSTNLIFKRALEIGLAMGEADREIRNSWPDLIQRLDANIINHFWNEELAAPSAYVINAPAWLPASHRSALGESLGILFSERFQPVAQQLVATYPRTPYGTPVISHQLPHAPPYHNQTIWPFVEAYALLAAKEAGNQRAYAHSFNGLIRAAALFQSHRENYHYASGRPDQTEINSDRQLWSIAGWLGAITKGLFGMDMVYNFDHSAFELQLKPNNPFQWGEFKIEDLIIRNTPVSISLKGSGSHVLSILVNGSAIPADASIPLEGRALQIEISLGPSADEGQLTLESLVLPESPRTLWQGDTLNWSAPQAHKTILELNGRILDTLTSSPIIIPDSLTGFFDLRSIDSMGLKSLPSQPNYLGASATLVLATGEPYFIELGEVNAFIRMSFNLPSDGNYLLRFVYSNGSGPINTGNTCGLAKLKINDWWLEQMISFPHTAAWDNWQTTGWSKAFFKAGENTIFLDQESLPVKNMNGDTNVFRVRSVEIVPITQ